MRTCAAPAIVLAVCVVLVGCNSGSGPGGDDDDGADPAGCTARPADGYPGQGPQCGGHAIARTGAVEEPRQHFVGAGILRRSCPCPASGADQLYDLSLTLAPPAVTDGAPPVMRFDRLALLVPAIAPGSYDAATCGEVSARSPSLARYDSRTGDSSATIEIAGATADVIWGDVNADVCTVTGSTVINGEIVYTYDCATVWDAQFTARIITGTPDPSSPTQQRCDVPPPPP